MKVAWASPQNLDNVSGNFLGYATGSAQLAAALARVSGVEVVPDTEPADAVVWLCHPEIFLDGNLGDGRKHILYTMYEGQPVPRVFKYAFQAAHGVIVPSRFCRSIFEPYFHEMKTKNVELVPLGFDPSIYTFKERQFDWSSGETFKFLWVGAPNARKGWHRLISTWSWLFEKEDRFEVRFKTTHAQDPEGYVANVGNAIYDCRRLPTEELAQLYHDHHCFVFPTSGEGFGLTALEAAATGIPIVTIKYSAIVDFLDETTAYFSSATWDWAEIERGHQYYCPHADVIPMGRRMIDVVRKYPMAKKKARKASERAHRMWTWDHAGQKLAEAIDRMTKRDVKYVFTPRESVIDDLLDIAQIVETAENEVRPADDPSALDYIQPPPPPHAEPAPDREGGTGA